MTFAKARPAQMISSPLVVLLIFPRILSLWGNTAITFIILYICSYGRVWVLVCLFFFKLAGLSHLSPSLSSSPPLSRCHPIHPQEFDHQEDQGTVEKATSTDSLSTMLPCLLYYDTPSSILNYTTLFYYYYGL